LSVLSRSVKRPSPWLYLIAGLLVAVWIGRAWLLLQDGGLFRVLGGDYSMYAAQAGILRSGDTQSIYDLSRIDTFVQPLRAYTTDPSEPLSVGPVAYPPIFAWLMVPFTLVPPPVGLALWTVLNLLGVGYLAWRVASVVPGTNWLLAMLALLGSFPVALGLLVGQPTALLGCAMAECYLSLRAGRDLRAGLWLSALLLKPQYGLLLGPILIWKRRWHAVLGVALGGLIILATSAVLVGLPTLLTFRAALSDMAPFGGGALVSPGQMINWRGLILNLRPSIGGNTGLLLTIVLGAITVGCTLLIWRGPWAAASRSFPARMAAMSLTTVLANYHSHAHGLTLFAVPLAASYGQPEAGRLTRWSLVALAVGPTAIIIGLDHWLLRDVIERKQVDVLIWSPLVQILLVLASGSLIMSVLRGKDAPITRPRTLDGPSPSDSGAEQFEESLRGS
jgi:glycosyl transferase family 87